MKMHWVRRDVLTLTSAIPEVTHVYSSLTVLTLQVVMNAHVEKLPGITQTSRSHTGACVLGSASWPQVCLSWSHVCAILRKN